MLPSIRRTKKVAKISVLTEGILFSILGFTAYVVFGDRFTPDLFILRKPYEGKNIYTEKIFQGMIFLFFILNTLGLSMYNTSIRDYVKEFVDFEHSKLKYMAVSLIPFFLICLSSAVYPNINQTLAFFGYTVYNFNGYIIPFLMAIQTLKYYNHS